MKSDGKLSEEEKNVLKNFVKFMRLFLGGHALDIDEVWLRNSGVRFRKFIEDKYMFEAVINWNEKNAFFMLWKRNSHKIWSPVIATKRVPTNRLMSW